MPPVPLGSKVLVSGANGYVAIWVVRTLLEKGYAVRGTVRTADKGRYLEKLFKSYGDKFEVVVVEDITKDGAFDEALQGIDAIEHIASPFHMMADDPQEIIRPAVKGTISILESALKQNIKRVVVTSSTAAILRIQKEPKIFSELDWNEQSIKEAEEQGQSASGAIKYRASKTLAEKAAWNVYEKNKDKISWDLVVLNPPFVFGPVIHEVSSPEALNTSSRQFYDAVVVDTPRSKEFLANQGSSYIDVRDAGEAHVLALEKEAAGGERIIISAGTYVWQDWIDVANSLSPSPIPSHSSLPLGFPGAGRDAVYLIRYDATKADRILGIKYRTKAELVQDTLADFEARGW